MYVQASKIALYTLQTALGGKRMNKSERSDRRVSPMDKHIIKSAANAVGMTVSAYLVFKACEDIGYNVTDKILEDVGKRSSGERATRKTKSRRRS